MNLTALVTDSVSELLIKIIEFTQDRQKIIAQNIRNVRKSSFVPHDLTVDEFSTMLNIAIDEYILNNRLVLCDTNNIKFKNGGTFEAKPIVDHQALDLLKESPDKYLELQVNKLLENSLNQRVAAELLRERQTIISMFELC